LGSIPSTGIAVVAGRGGQQPPQSGRSGTKTRDLSFPRNVERAILGRRVGSRGLLAIEEGRDIPVEATRPKTTSSQEGG
jgi:hypothetical protein